MLSFVNNEQSEQNPVTLPGCQEEAEHVIPGQSSFEPEPAMNAHLQALLQAAEERAESNFESSVECKVTRSQGLNLNWNPQMNQSPTVNTETADADKDIVS